MKFVTKVLVFMARLALAIFCTVLREAGAGERKRRASEKRRIRRRW